MLTEAPGLLHSAWLAANARVAAADVDAPRPASADLHSAWLVVNAHAAAAAAEADDAASAVHSVTPAALAPPPNRACSSNRLSMIAEESEAESEGSDTWSITTPDYWYPEAEMVPASPASPADSASMSESSSEASDTWSVTTPTYGAPDNGVDSSALADVAEDEATTSRSILGEEEQATEDFIARLIRGCPFFTASLRNSKHIFISVVNNIAEVDRSPPATLWDSVRRLILGTSRVSRQQSAFQANFVQRYEDDIAEENLWLTAIRSDKTAFTSVVHGCGKKSVSQLSVWGSFYSFFWNTSTSSHQLPSYEARQLNVNFAECFDDGFEG